MRKGEVPNWGEVNFLPDRAEPTSVGKRQKHHSRRGDELFLLGVQHRSLKFHTGGEQGTNILLSPCTALVLGVGAGKNLPVEVRGFTLKQIDSERGWRLSRCVNARAMLGGEGVEMRTHNG